MAESIDPIRMSSDGPASPVLNWNMQALIAARGTNPFQISERAGIHPHTIGQMARNVTTRVSLATLTTLAHDLGVGIAPAPDGTRGAAGIFRWADDGTLAWNLHTLVGDRPIRELFFATTVERSALRRFIDGTATQASIEYLEAIARYFNVPLAGPPPGTESDECLLVWADTRIEPAPETDEEPDESPIAGEPSRICRGPVCLRINPAGVEKRLDAFPLSKAYAHGRGPICKVCRRQQEKDRRAAKKAKGDTTPDAADDLASGT